MARQRIDLSTAAEEQDTVVIDGVPYPLIDASDLSMLQMARIRQLSARFAEIAGKRDMDAEEAREADQLIDEAFVTFAPTVPKEIAAKLSPKSKGRVALAFFEALVEAVSDQASIQQPSPLSSASTGATQSDG